MLTYSFNSQHSRIKNIPKGLQFGRIDPHTIKQSNNNNRRITKIVIMIIMVIILIKIITILVIVIIIISIVMEMIIPT